MSNSITIQLKEIAKAINSLGNRQETVGDYLSDPGVIGAIVTLVGIIATVFVAYHHLKRQMTLQVIENMYHGSRIKSRMNKIMDYNIGVVGPEDQGFADEFNELSSYMPTIRHVVLGGFVSESMIRSYFESHFAAIIVAVEKLYREGVRDYTLSQRTIELMVKWGIIDDYSHMPTSYAYELVQERYSAVSYLDESGNVIFLSYQKLR